MPITRHKNIYGENPQQSQLGAAGTLNVPDKTYEVPGGVSKLPYTIPSIGIGGPNLGYGWEIINFYIPTSLILFSTDAKSMTVVLEISVGSQILFSVRQSVTLKETPGFTFANALWSEAPPITQQIPGGQQIIFSLTVSSVEPISSEVLILSVSTGREFLKVGKETYQIQSVTSSINYRFV